MFFNVMSLAGGVGGKSQGDISTLVMKLIMAMNGKEVSFHKKENQIHVGIKYKNKIISKIIFGKMQFRSTSEINSHVYLSFG